MPEHRQAYVLLLRKAVAIGWPRLWRSDLTKHDRARLLVPDAPQEFCWSVRETGTWLYTGSSGDLWRLLYWEHLCMWGSRFFHYKDGVLSELPFHEAVSVVEELETRMTGRLDEGAATGWPLLVLRREAAARKALPYAS